MRGAMVYFAGEAYWIVDEAIALVGEEESSTHFMQISCLERIERASLPGNRFPVWLPSRSVYLPVSSIDYAESEWVKGLTNGVNYDKESD